MKQWKRKRDIIPLIIIFLTVCIIYPKLIKPKDRYMSRAFNQKELFGTWSFSEKTLKRLKEENINPKFLNKQANQLIIHADNSFECKITLPMFFLDAEQTHYNLEGKWWISTWANNELIYYTLCLNSSETAPSSLNFFDFNITEVDGQLQLWTYLTDKMIYVFEKETN